MKKFTMTVCGLMMLGSAMFCSCGGNNEKAEEAVAEKSAPEAQQNMKIAFVLIDTLQNQYVQFKDASDAFQKKQANAEATISEKGKTFAAQVQEFQRKAQSNQYTQEQFNQEQARLQKLQQDIESLQARLSASLQEDYQKELNALTDTIKNFMALYAKQKGYDFILCKGSGLDQVLYAKETYDITNEVVAALNKRYAKQTKK